MWMIVCKYTKYFEDAANCAADVLQVWNWIHLAKTTLVGEKRRSSWPICDDPSKFTLQHEYYTCGRQQQSDTICSNSALWQNFMLLLRSRFWLRADEWAPSHLGVGLPVFCSAAHVTHSYIHSTTLSSGILLILVLHVNNNIKYIAWRSLCARGSVLCSLPWERPGEDLHCCIHVFFFQYLTTPMAEAFSAYMHSCLDLQIGCFDLQPGCLWNHSISYLWWCRQPLNKVYCLRGWMSLDVLGLVAVPIAKKRMLSR